jgi:predicted ATP-grasp superfamily ATP-dependent carboligase
MTRVFVYEFTCAAPAESADSAGAASLRAAGEAMLDAVMADFQRVPSVEAFTIRNAVNEETVFREAARSADWSLVIAPEFHDILLTRCQWVLEEGGKLLGPSPEAVRLCSDKLALFRHWDRHGVRTPETIPADASAGVTWNGPIVRKPRFGAGSLDTRLLRQFSDKPATSTLGRLIEQPFVSGLPASVALLIGSRNRLALQPASQRLSADGRFQYLGGRVPLQPELARRAEQIAQQAIDAVFGLFGYVGVDLVLGDDGRDWAIEINPRLTTSYVGFRALADANLAEVMLRLAEGCKPPAITWKPGSVEFAPDATVAYV